MTNQSKVLIFSLVGAAANKSDGLPGLLRIVVDLVNVLTCKHLKFSVALSTSRHEYLLVHRVILDGLHDCWALSWS